MSVQKTGKKRFIYRFRRTDGKLVEMTIGYFPQMQLAEDRIKLQELKKIRESGYCPRELREQQKINELQLKKAQENKSKFTIKKMIDLYLTEYIQDRHTKDGKVIKGARKLKGQNEVRRT
ncbi:Arm DNA-binding domain-containing protein, partial [Gilliamella sp. Fer4-1]|uniref:Arm DNA-binding domain-containing protein n=2 Tax=Gilliamella TaxID=1193503 RepID=UPI001146CE9C